MNGPIVFILEVLTLIAGFAAGYFFNRYQVEKKRREEQAKARASSRKQLTRPAKSSWMRAPKR